MEQSKEALEALSLFLKLAGVSKLTRVVFFL